MRINYYYMRYIKYVFFAVSGLLIVILSTSAYAEWSSGIGTGISRQSRDGDLGFHSDRFGSVVIDYDLDADDFDDLMESAFGFGGFFSDGKWLIEYSLGYLELEDTAVRERKTASPLTGKVTFETTSAEVTVGHPVFGVRYLVLGVHGGIRYLRHEYDASVTDGVTTISKKMDKDWADALVGITAMVPITKKWMWNNKFNAGFGGSEGTYFVSTSLAWRFHKRWSASLSGKYMAVEYENGRRGNPGWYLYDVDESSVGVSVLFHW